MPECPPIERITWESPTWGRVALRDDWTGSQMPPVGLRGGLDGLKITREAPFEFAKLSGYFVDGEEVVFVAPLRAKGEKIFVAGDFNGWAAAAADKAWELKSASQEGWAELRVPADRLGESRLFKFVSSEGVWREPVEDAPNVVLEKSARNYFLDPRRSGAHVFRFEVASPHNWTNLGELVWRAPQGGEVSCPIFPGRGFYQTFSDLPMGAILEGSKTRFRLFAPRATKVSLFYSDGEALKTEVALTPEVDGVWSVVVPTNLEGATYYYRVEGPERPDTMFGVNIPIVDPWSVLVRNGESVVADRERILKNAPAPFKAPLPADLIIAEAHLRDMVAKAPVPMTDADRRGYTGVKKLLEWDDNPVTLLNVNAVELQPLMEFDGNGKEYHWGYMPINFFSPAEAFGSIPGAATRIRELQEMVEAFHKRGVAVILDVVFNHMGSPAGLMFVDKAYYFHTTVDGTLTNWSGCGNDLRVQSAMAERLCLDALEWWVKAYGIDGVRFDLAEMLGVDFLAKAQTRLRAIKPHFILIAEPWSFHGHIASALKDLDYASWNDGYREFLPTYLKGKSSAEGLKYFISGSVGGMTERPTQSLNYVESHDDRTWLDKITQNPANNGFYPTMSDRRLTHMMAATVMMSLGVPMVALGQEALKSKYGVANTYQRGDLNAYDYLRTKDFPGSLEYFSRLIAFRKSSNGKALRVSKLTEGYLEFFELAGTSVLGVLFNADKSLDAPRILFAINPSGAEVMLPVNATLKPDKWLCIADHERVRLSGLGPIGVPLWSDGKLEVAAVSVSVWVEK